MLEELGVNATRLIMPTKTNADKFEALLGAAQNLLDMKKQVDRAEQELRILRAQKELGANGQAPVESGTPASAIKVSLWHSAPSCIRSH
jgi:DNA methyltransferase 1-associated protein 1